MEELEAKGLFIDDVQKLRVMQPELAAQTQTLKDECGGFVENITDFQTKADGFTAFIDEVGQALCNILRSRVDC
jgi:intraflagellar transport protein 20